MNIKYIVFALYSIEYRSKKISKFLHSVYLNFYKACLKQRHSTQNSMPVPPESQSLHVIQTCTSALCLHVYLFYYWDMSKWLKHWNTGPLCVSICIVRPHVVKPCQSKLRWVVEISICSKCLNIHITELEKTTLLCIEGILKPLIKQN